ncbi:MAG TPA: hypothetical protein VFB38_20930 [Chthonomonadaceae bacterium]|nr:hypothetical protein [Chthonomonadaceae bacterium]
MYRHSLQVLLLVSLLVLPRAAFPSVTEQLPADPQLEKTITLNVTGISLSDLLKKHSTHSLSLTCSPSCANLKLQIHLKERPLRSVLLALAELLPGKWTIKEGKTAYELQMDEAALALRERWWRIFLREREQALAAQAAYLLAEMRATPQERPTSIEGPDHGGPNPIVERQFFNSLSPALQERIANQINDTPFYSADTVSFYGTNADEGAVIVPFADLTPQAQEVLLNLSPDLQSHPELRANSFLQFTNGAFILVANCYRPDGKLAVSSMSMQTSGLSSQARLGMLRLNQERLPQMLALLGRDAPTAWKQLAAYQERCVWNNALPDRMPSRQYPPPDRARVLRWLAEKADMEFIADYYSRPGDPQAEDWNQPLTRPLEEELNYRAAQLDMSWKRHDNLYLFRNNRWYRDDYLEVASALARKWLEQRLADGPQRSPASGSALKARMDWEAAFVSKLTRWQIANGLKWLRAEENREPPLPSETTAFPFQSDAERTLLEYNVARFYTSLTEQARTSLLNGALDFASLNAEQQQLAQYLLPMLPVALKAASGRMVHLGLTVRERTVPKACLTYQVH